MNKIKLLIYTATSKRGNGQTMLQIFGQKVLYKISLDDLAPILPEKISMSMAMSKQETYTIQVSEHRFYALNLIN
jgi:hypothetical protein